MNFPISNFGGEPHQMLVTNDWRKSCSVNFCEDVVWAALIVPGCYFMIIKAKDILVHF